MFFKRVFVGSSLNIITLVLNVAVAMVMMPYIIHSLGNHHYGLWILVASFIGYYGLLDFGMSTAVTRFISRADGQGNVDEMNVILNTSTVFFMILGLGIFALSTAAAFIAPHFAETDQYVIQMLWLTIGVTCIFQFGLRGFYGVMFARVRHDIVGYTTLGKLTVRTGLIVYALSNGYGVVALAVITMVTELMVYAVDMYILTRICPEMKISWKYVHKGRTKELFKYGIFSMVNQISELLRLRALPLIVTASIGVIYVVYFSIAIRLMEIYRDVINRVVNILVPVFSNYEGSDDMKSVKRIFWIAYRLNIAMSVIIGAGLFLFCRPFIAWWIGPDYTLASDLTILLSIGFLVGMFQETGKIALFGISKHSKFSVVSAIESATGAVLGVIFGYLYGPIGIAAGITISMIVFELGIKPKLLADALDISLIEYYKTLVEVGLKLSIPIICYGVLMETWMTSSIFSILISGVGLCIISIPFVWISLNQDGKDMLESKLFVKVPLLKRAYAK